MSNSKRHITFIINPVSGTTKKKNIPGLIEEFFADTEIETGIRYTEYAGHAKEIAAELAQSGTTEIIAVGGDGTINEIVNGMAGTEALMGIIPSGSGNGLARHCKIPMKARKAMEIISNAHVQKVDLMRINGEYSANVSGVGFDAHVAHKFQYSGKRGLASYAKITMSEFVKYKAAEYELSIDGKEMKRKAFFVSLANSSQFGNNAFIAPEASITDGLIDVCILHPFPKISSAIIMERVMAKTINNSKFMEIIQAKKIQIKNTSGIYHLDGDPRENGEHLEIEIMPGILKLIVPEKQKI
jgi:YegS/Rv2252/BmrU family lipid kinase